MVLYRDGESSLRRKSLTATSDVTLEDNMSASERTLTEQNHPLTQVHPLQSSQKIKKQTHEGSTSVDDRRSICERYVTDGWLLEILYWIIAAASTTSIVAILHMHDGIPVSRWHASITINTAIATFSTIAKGSIMILVASCLSQLKWIWFNRRTRSLVDIQDFDDASRGAVGSIKLLATLSGGLLGAVGAFITILSLAASPATQQLLSFKTSSIATAGYATAPRCRNFTGGTLVPEGTGIWAFDSLQLKEATYGGIVQSANTPLSPIEPSCLSGNCTWERYQSLAICASVEDVSDQLSNTSATFEALSLGGSTVEVTGWILPNGAGVLNSQLNITASTPRSVTNFYLNSSLPLRSLAFGDVLDPISDFYLTFTVPAPGSAYPSDFPYDVGSDHSLELPLSHLAFQCVLQLCIQTYKTNTVNGISNTQIISSFINNTYVTIPSTSERIGSWYNYDPSSIYNTNARSFDGATYVGSIGARIRLQHYFLSVFNGSYGNAMGVVNGGLHGLGSIAPVVNLDSTTDTATAISSAIGISSGITDREIYFNNTRAMMNNIATSLTNSIRQGGDSAEFAVGRDYTDEIVFVVHWLWLIFPASLLTLSLLLLVGTITSSSRSKSLIWKSSAMALIQILSNDGRKELGNPDYTSKMDESAKRIPVSLENEGDGWKLVTNAGKR